MSNKRHSTSWDPVLLIAQIVAMQALHYVTLSIITPPLLSFFAEPGSLAYEGGAANVGMIMDWREMAGRPTVRGMRGGDRWNSYAGVWSGGKQFGLSSLEDHWDGSIDPLRGWTIAVCWMLASGADVYYLYTLIRRPRLILDFVLTLAFNHLVLTTYYSASLPTSLFFWVVLLSSCAGTIIVAEQLCVKREMNEGLVIMAPPTSSSSAPSGSGMGGEGEDLEMGRLMGDRRD